MAILNVRNRQTDRTVLFCNRIDSVLQRCVLFCGLHHG